MSDEQRMAAAVEALSRGLPPRRGVRRPGPSGAAFGLPAWMEDPDPARHRQRTPEEQAARAEADALGRLHGQGNLPQQFQDGPETGDPLQDAVRDYRRQQEPLYLDAPDSNPAGGNPSPPPAGPSAGEQAQRIMLRALLEHCFGVKVPAEADTLADEDAYLLAIVRVLAPVAVAHAAGQAPPGRRGVTEPTHRGLPALLQAEKEGRSGTLSAPERGGIFWQQAASSPKGLR